MATHNLSIGGFKNNGAVSCAHVLDFIEPTCAYASLSVCLSVCLYGLDQKSLDNNSLDNNSLMHVTHANLRWAHCQRQVAFFSLTLAGQFRVLNNMD